MPNDYETARVAAKHVIVNAGLQMAMLAGHVVATAFLGAVTFGAIELPGVVGVARAILTAFAFAGVVWTPLNAVGLYKRRPWARKSTIAYWIMGLPLCCCFPTGLYGLWSLTRPGVRNLFETDGAR